MWKIVAGRDCKAMMTVAVAVAVGHWGGSILAVVVFDIG